MKAIELKCSNCGGKILMVYGITQEGMAFVCDSCQSLIHMTFEDMMKISFMVSKDPNKPDRRLN